MTRLRQPTMSREIPSSWAVWLCVVLGMAGCRLQEGRALDWSAQHFYERGRALEARGDDTAADHVYGRAAGKHPSDPWAVLATLRRVGWTQSRAQEESIGRRHGGRPGKKNHRQGKDRVWTKP